ncbi:hypothetical protein QR98_0062280, partial [Sarcoptes scabiei]
TSGYLLLVIQKKVYITVSGAKSVWFDSFIRAFTYSRLDGRCQFFISSPEFDFERIDRRMRRFYIVKNLFNVRF